ALLFINISNDIGHKSAKELLTATHIDVRRAPGGLQVGGNAGEIGSWGCMFDLSGLGESGFTRFHAPERYFPALLKLGSDQPVIRVASGIATFRERCLVSRLLQVQVHHAVPLFQIIPMHSVSFHCRLDRHWRYGPQYLLADRWVDAGSAKSHASRFGQH